MNLEIAINFDEFGVKETKWSDNISIVEIYNSKKLKKEITRKKLLMAIASYDVIGDEFLLLLKYITTKEIVINFYYPNFTDNTKVELIFGNYKVSFIPSKEFKEMLQNL